MAESRKMTGNMEDENDLLEQANILFSSGHIEPEEDILEILRSLEEVDEESFPYYTLVRWLRSSIEDHLEEFVSSEIDISSVNGISPDTWKAAAREVYNSIIEAPQMVSLLENIRNGVNRTDVLTNELLHLNIVPSRQASRLSMCESDSSMDDGWWNHSILPQQYQQLAEDISGRKSIQTRIESLKILQGAHMSDAVEGPHWMHLRRGLREALCDENDSIFSLGLKIHAKLIAPSSVHIATKEAFVNLIESLSTQYMSRKMLPHLPTYESGIDFNKPLHFRIMKITKLISDAQKEIPKEWIRFSTRKVEEMIESFIDLLAMHTYDGMSREKFLYPFHLLSIIDYNASWCQYWLHGLFSRSLLLRAFLRSSPLIRFLSETVIKWMEDFDAIQYLNVKSSLQKIKDDPQGSNYIPGYMVQYTVFTSSISILQSLLPFEGGRMLIPISNSEVEASVSLNNIVLSSVEFLNNHSEEIGMCGPVLILVNFISVILNESKISIESPLVLAILQPILEAHADKSQEVTYPIQIHTVKLVEVLVNSEDGIRSLMGGRKPRGSFRHRNSTENLGCLARTLAEYITAVLKNHRNADPKLLDTILSICTKLKISHDLFLYLEPTGIFQTFNSFYKFLKNRIEHEMLSPYSRPVNNYCTLLHKLIQCYLEILKTPKGMLCVERDGILYSVMQDLFENNLISWIRPNNCLLVAQASCYTGGARAVREERIIAEQLMKVWQKCEGSPTEFYPEAERQYQETEAETISILGSVCSSLISVQAQLSERPGSEETLLALSGPCSLPELIEATLLDEEPGENEADSYTCPPPISDVRHLGFLLLCQLCSCPDTALIIQHRFSMQSHLLQQQKENTVSDDENAAVILDSLSVQRNHILVQTLLYGGPGERSIPPLDMPDTGEYTWSLFCALPVPKEYFKVPLRSASKKQGELQKFLSDTRPGVHDAQWLMHCRKAAKSTLTQCLDEIKGPILLDLIKQVLRASPNASFLLGNVNNVQLFPEDNVAIPLVLRYGAHLRLIQANSQMHENLGQLLKFSRTLKPFKLESFSGFDWLVATVFLILSGNLDRCQSFLQSVATLKSSPMLWSALAERCNIRPKLEATFSHLLEMILFAEEPHIFWAFQRSGVSAGNIACSWLRRCFWGVLDWAGVTQWLLLAILSEPDLTLYLVLALLIHMQHKILTATSNQNLYQAITVEQLEKFNVGEFMPLIEKLSKRYRHKVLPHLQAILSA